MTAIAPSLAEDVAARNRASGGVSDEQVLDDLDGAIRTLRSLPYLNGKVDAFGVGGADLGMMVDNKWYPLYSVQKMVRFIEKTPVVDGAGLKNTLEYKLAPFIDAHLGDYIKEKKAFVTMGSDRWGMTKSFVDNHYECVFGDFMFRLGLSFPVRSTQGIKRLAAILLPALGHLPYEWLYTLGEKQEKRVAKLWRRRSTTTLRRN